MLLVSTFYRFYTILSAQAFCGLCLYKQKQPASPTTSLVWSVYVAPKGGESQRISCKTTLGQK